MERKNVVAGRSDDRGKNNGVKDALGIMEEQRQDKRKEEPEERNNIREKGRKFGEKDGREKKVLAYPISNRS
ncbi:hypothetical protein WN48_06386 [Eufriesea mexicana]|uniref:Uncharacterized protein n=1 Tax=Eufriesea mexicana TaxID=516756 RepID=A0A310S8W5_9HYME|nr:hypothetical protein WN48_06386 [Eufriesea mexicana]